MREKSRLAVFAQIATILSLFAVVIFGINQWRTRSINSDLNFIKPVIQDYFDAAHRRDYISLETMFDDNIIRFYDLNSPSIQQILENQKKYYSVYKYTRYSINWESIKVKNYNNGYNINFQLKYKVKEKKNSRYQIFNLTIHMIISEDFKIKSIYEVHSD